MKLKLLDSNESFFPLLLLIPLASAILALTSGLFIFKAGVALSGILILLFLFYRGNQTYEKVWPVIAAFVLSIGGDWFLSHKQDQSWMFMAGIALFFFAHAGYLLYALKNGKINQNVLLGLLVGYLVFFFVWLRPGIAGLGLKSAALFYLVISCVSLSAAVGIDQFPRIAKVAYVAGISLILFSDTIIAFKEFTLLQMLNFLILPTYYLAQILITFALMRVMKEQFNLQDIS